MSEASANALARVGESLWGDDAWPEEMRKALDVDATLFDRWMTGKRAPTISVLERLKELIDERRSDLYIADEILTEWRNIDGALEPDEQQ